ncbi:hypothetical protein AAG570_004867 [Ranatra chinensis]|uniref:Uncharacterized protein n=1 Tax=Ranatra chinensis TaxID=642074 RepID=A0ABD0XZ41_9HEMI
MTNPVMSHPEEEGCPESGAEDFVPHDFFKSLNDWVDGLVNDLGQTPFLSSTKYICRLVEVMPPVLGLASEEQLKAVGIPIGQDNKDAFNRVIESEISPEIAEISRYYATRFWKPEEATSSQETKEGKSPEGVVRDISWDNHPHESRIEDLSFAISEEEEDGGGLSDDEDIEALLREVYLTPAIKDADDSYEPVIDALPVEDEEEEERRKEVEENERKDREEEEVEALAVESNTMGDIMGSELQGVEKVKGQTSNMSAWLKTCLEEKFKDDSPTKEMESLEPEVEECQSEPIDSATEEEVSTWEPLGPDERPSLDDVDVFWPDACLDVEGEGAAQGSEKQVSSVDQVTVSMRNMTWEQMRFMQGYLELLESKGQDLKENVGLTMDEILIAANTAQVVGDNVVVRQGKDDPPEVTRVISKLKDIFKKQVLVTFVDKSFEGGAKKKDEGEGERSVKGAGKQETKKKEDKPKPKPGNSSEGNAAKTDTKKSGEWAHRNKSKYLSKRKDKPKRLPQFE